MKKLGIQVQIFVQSEQKENMNALSPWDIFTIILVVVRPFRLLPSFHINVKKLAILLFPSAIDFLQCCLCAFLNAQVGSVTTPKISTEPLESY